jgi:hypothetical protein
MGELANSPTRLGGVTPFYHPKADLFEPGHFHQASRAPSSRRRALETHDSSAKVDQLMPPFTSTIERALPAKTLIYF